MYALLFLALAWATWRKPSYGVAALVALVAFAFPHAIGPTTLTLSKVALLATIAGLAARRAGTTVLGAPAARTLLLAGSAVALATALSIASATFRGAAVRETLKAVEYVVLFGTVVVAARADGATALLRITFALSLACVSVLALAQEVTGAPSAILFLGHPFPRIAGPLEGPNQLSGYLGIALCVVAALALARSRPALERSALGVGIAALVLTLSRAALPATLAGLVIVAGLSPRRPSGSELRAAVAGALAGIGVIAAWGFAFVHTPAGFGLLTHFWTLAEAEHPGGVGTRSQLWYAAISLWRSHPVLGIGAGNFENELGLAGYPALHTHANSLYLQALVEGGLPLEAATLALVVASIAVFARGPFREPFVVGALAASVGLALHQIFDLLVFYPKVGELWWIALALGAARKDAACSEHRASLPERMT